MSLKQALPKAQLAQNKQHIKIGIKKFKIRINELSQRCQMTQGVRRSKNGQAIRQLHA